MSENRQFLEKFFPIASFIAAIVGPKCEVVIHDVSDLERSIIFIENGHISGRKVGDASTDLVLKLIKDEAYHEEQFIANYKASGKQGQSFRSSTYYIKNDSGTLVGLMCLNIDVTHMEVAAEWIQHVLQGGSLVPPLSIGSPQEDKQQSKEYLQGNADDLLQHMISTVLSKITIPIDRLSSKEKIDIVRELNEQGVFLLKGGVSQVAASLSISEPTVYRYLQKLK
ncbi:PAS domain-containing protein [Paenibacillus sp. VCA1]|uniref:helix-turn-helix transcriptional regulator n=1 Tax=Paenibacillus sp. VCA1 TaxID=3039148 RepID=UPI00287249C9|nr:PAS domain-containing protein [Paenibacillus sp. VCA1]MDR9854863.1 PAS domain-containing protein [Paenibacillus sp. VCA1]